MIARLAPMAIAAMTVLFVACSVMAGMGRMTRHDAFLAESATLAVAGAALLVVAGGVEGRYGLFARTMGVVVLIFGLVMAAVVLMGLTP